MSTSDLPMAGMENMMVHSLPITEIQLNAFGSYGLGTGQNWGFIRGVRSQLATDFNFDIQTLTYNQNHNFRGGIDWFLGSKQTIGIQVNGILGNTDKVTDTYSENIIRETGLVRDILVSQNQNDEKKNQINLNLNYQFRGTDGSGLNLDIDYGKFDFQTLAFQPNTLYAPGKTSILGTEDFSSKAPNIIDIQTLQLDYHRPVWEGNLALGGKLSKVTTDNSFSLFNIVNELNVLDSARSSSFLYREKVNAGYISFEKKLEKIRFQLGLRAEHTNILGDLTRVAKQNTSDRAVDSGYVSLFPSANLNYQFNKNHTTQISYQRRIRRPNYQNLNPFEVRWSSDAFRWGNPFLKPQFSDKFEISHSYKSLQFSLAYTETRDFMSMITDTLDDNTVYLTWINLDSRKVANANVYYSFKPIKGKTWNVVTNASVSYAQNKLDLGPGKEVNLTYTAFTLFHQHNFTLPGKFIMNVTGQYFSPTVWGANFVNRQRFRINAGIQKKFLNKKANVNLAITDILNTYGWKATQELGALAIDMRGGGETRQIKMSFSYLFGNAKMGVKQRNTGIDSEKQRTQ
ncbi:MAG: outer membrane beta-barrel family protein [Bacteroidia bacterium]